MRVVFVPPIWHILSVVCEGFVYYGQLSVYIVKSVTLVNALSD